MFDVLARLAPLLAVAALLGACSAGGGGAAHSASTPTAPARNAPTRATTPASSAAVSPGRVRVAAARSCPLASTGFVQDTLGMRLGRITVLRRAGQTIGCRFYALQNSPLHDSEHLPGPHQPAMEVSVQPYETAVAAHNAVALAAGQGRNPTRVQFGGGHLGACYQTDFDPGDHGQDWACDVNVGPVRVLVRTVDTTGTFSSIALTNAVVRRA